MELHEKVAFPKVSIAWGLIAVQKRSCGISAESVTEPLKPFIALTLIVDAAEFPDSTGGGEMTEISKSPACGTTVIGMIIE